MDVKDLLRQYATGQRRFVLASLRGVNLVGVCLAEADLSRANLTEANLSRANLSRAILVKANLTRANLRGANLKQADLRQANLTGAEIGLEALQPEAYAGAILPDGSRSPLIASGAATQPAAEPAPDAIAQTRLAAINTTINRQSSSLAAADEAGPLQPATGLRRGSPATFSWQQLPWLRLAAWGIGYGFLGLVLICLRAEFWAWPLVWLSSVLWGWQPGLLRSQPLIAAVAVVLATGLSWLGLGLGASLWGLAAIGLRLTNYGWKQALELGGWLGGAGCLTVTTIPLLLSRQPTLAVAIASTPPLGMMILLGLLFSQIGLTAHPQLRTLSISQPGIVAGLGLAAALGLILGGSMGLLALRLV